MRSNYIFILALLISNLLLSQKKVVEILSTNELKAGKTDNHQKLVGKVILRFDDTKLFCDSAEVNSLTNDFVAWGKVYINKPNQVKAWGEKLVYNGTSLIGMLIGDVKMKNEGSILTTDLLYFDEKNTLIYYLNGANTITDDATIFSKKGFYDTNSKYLKLKDSIRVKNPNYHIKCDTLEYSTISKTSYFFGPTLIELEKEQIYCEAGFHNQSLNIAQFEENAILKNEGQVLEADSIYYDKTTGIAMAYYNVKMQDTSDNIIVTGEEGYFDQNNNYSFVTKNVMFMQGSDNDTLYLTSDTLIATEDTLKNKSFYAFNNVQLFQNDMQGICDSLAYNFKDSLIRLYYDPVIWNGENQITGDTIEILSFDNKLQKLFIRRNGFIVSLTDSAPLRYDQIKGRNLVGYFKDGKMDIIHVLGNGQTIYYAKESDGKYSGVNKAICSNIKVTFKDAKVERIKFITLPEAIFYPLNDFPDSESKLEKFKWRETDRPKSKKSLSGRN